MQLASRKSKIIVPESALTLATQSFMLGQGHDDYVEQLQKIINIPNNGESEYERGVIEGQRRFCINLINTLTKRK